MKKWLSVALGSFALLAAGYIALPRYTIEQLEVAAREENVQQLQHYIDFPALRDNFKLRLQRQLHNSVGEDLPEEMRQFFAASVNLLVSPLLQQLVTPEGVGELLRGGRALSDFERELYRLSSSSAGDVPEVQAEREADWQLRHWRFTGVSRVSADYGDERAVQLRLILELHGWRWQLVDLELLQSGAEM